MSLDDSERMEFEHLKFSSKTIGQLYPVLVDYHGKIIDGEHRLKANENWKKVKVDHIITEKDRLLAKIISNNVRRNVSTKEKNELLGMLGEILLEQGVERGQIAYKIAKESGMSYRWVIKYLPDKFKDKLQSDRNRFKTLRLVACHASGTNNFVNPPKDFMKIIKNTHSVALIMKKSYFEKLEKNANDLGTTPINMIYNAIQLISKNRSFKEKENTTSTGDFHKGISLRPMMKPVFNL